MRINIEHDNQKHKHPKPWRGIVLVRQNRKAHSRETWTDAQWQTYVDAREDKRTAPRVGRRRKSTRLAVLQRRQDSAARSARMLAYHARRAAQSEEGAAP